MSSGRDAGLPQVVEQLGQDHTAVGGLVLTALDAVGEGDGDRLARAHEVTDRPAAERRVERRAGGRHRVGERLRLVVGAVGGDHHRVVGDLDHDVSVAVLDARPACDALHVRGFACYTLHPICMLMCIKSIDFNSGGHVTALRRTVLPLAGFAVVIAAWWLTATTGLTGKDVPTPGDVFAAAWEGCASPRACSSTSGSASLRVLIGVASAARSRSRWASRWRGSPPCARCSTRSSTSAGPCRRSR